MMRHRKLTLGLLAAAALLGASLFLAQRYCPPQGVAFTQDRRAVHRLKNRTSLPQETDFDPRVTLSTLLQPGDDSTRWSTSNAARVEGYVVSLANAGVELANCYAPCRRDIHINVALRPDAPASEQVVLEITPPMRKWALGNGWDWSEAKSSKSSSDTGVHLKAGCFSINTMPVNPKTSHPEGRVIGARRLGNFILLPTFKSFAELSFDASMRCFRQSVSSRIVSMSYMRHPLHDMRRD